MNGFAADWGASGSTELNFWMHHLLITERYLHVLCFLCAVFFSPV